MFYAPRFSTCVVTLGLAATCACEPQTYIMEEEAETRALDEALFGPLDAAPMEFADADAVIAALGRARALDTWIQLDTDGDGLGQPIEGVGPRAGREPVESAISVTSTATGGYESFWSRADRRDGALSLHGSGGVRSGARSKLFAGQLVSGRAGAMRFASVEAPSPDDGTLTRHSLIQAAQRWEVIELGADADDGCVLVWRDDEIALDTCP